MLLVRGGSRGHARINSSVWASGLWHPREGRVDNGALRALVLALLLPLAVPAAAGASTVSVEPFREPPDIDPFASCGRYMRCPADMVVVTAGSGEKNHLAITEAAVSPGQTRYLVRDKLAPVVAGAGCERVDEPPPAVAVVCTAGAIGPQDLGDGDDWLASPGGWASGGDGDDVMTVSFGDADGGEGDDVLLVDTGEADGEGGDDVVIGGRGVGGGGHDRLIVGSGLGESGDDTLSCFPRDPGCFLNGGAGHDVLTGETGRDRLLARGVAISCTAAVATTRSRRRRQRPPHRWRWPGRARRRRR
jgi:hypothetical protein